MISNAGVGNAYSLLVGVPTSEATMEIIVVVPHKKKKEEKMIT